MINKDFIAGIALGALHAPACNIDEDRGGYNWHKDIDVDGFWNLNINYKCGFFLSTLNTAKEMVSSFCECTSVIVGNGVIQFVIKEGGVE
ncbi:MAG: hypothetical protein IKQ20_06180 [Bacteroidales bacterium]|nr:hypothetical protein [Bacteroidales bacterium]